MHRSRMRRTRSSCIGSPRRPRLSAQTIAQSNPPKARTMQNAPLREQHPGTSSGSGVGVVRRWCQARGSAADATDAGRSSRAFGSGALSGPGKCARGGARYPATATSATRRRANERPPAVTPRARATRPHGTSRSRADNSERRRPPKQRRLITYSPDGHGHPERYCVQRQLHRDGPRRHVRDQQRWGRISEYPQCLYVRHGRVALGSCARSRRYPKSFW